MELWLFCRLTWYIHNLNEKKYSPELYNNYQLLEKSTTDTYQKNYLKFKVEAIDYALIEKVPNLLVIPAAFDWMDLGSFSDLH